MKRYLLALLVVGSLLTATSCNQQVFDTTYKFNKVVICLPNGEIIEGECKSWLDFENSDMIQVKVGDKTYLTHITNVCLISE
jgi:hypothetical protein